MSDARLCISGDADARHQCVPLRKMVHADVQLFMTTPLRFILHFAAMEA